MALPFLYRREPLRVQAFYGFRSATHLYLTARALRTAEPVFEKRSFWRGFRTMASLYTSREVPGLHIELTFTFADGSRQTQTAETGPEGYARFKLAFDQGAAPAERTRWETVTLRWDGDDGDRQETAAFVLAPGTQTKLGIISDIDDTILETGITGSLRAIARNWKRVMAQMPSERVAVPGVSSFFEAIGGDAEKPQLSPINPDAPEARVRPVFYVSSSPWNLFSYLITFKRERRLPLGPVMLRDWGLNRRTLGKEGHGSHKKDAVRHILKTFPDLQFALIGDDTQKDLAAFGAIAAEFPGRIAAVFIRAVSDKPPSDEAEHARDMIERAGVPFWSGNDYAEAKAFLRGAGLDLSGGVKKLVRAASEGD